MSKNRLLNSVAVAQGPAVVDHEHRVAQFQEGVGAMLEAGRRKLLRTVVDVDDERHLSERRRRWSGVDRVVALGHLHGLEQNNASDLKSFIHLRNKLAPADKQIMNLKF